MEEIKLVKVVGKDIVQKVWKNVPFIPGARVQFYTDVTPEQRKNLQNIYKDDNIKKLDKDDVLDEVALDNIDVEKVAGFMASMMSNWNFADEKGIILPINADTYKNKLTSKTQKWIAEVIREIGDDVMGTKKKLSSKPSSPSRPTEKTLSQ